MLTFALMEWVCVGGGEPERSGPKIYVSRAVRGSRKNRAQQSGALSGRSRSGRGAVSEDHRNGL